MYFHTIETESSILIKLKQCVVIRFLVAEGCTPEEVYKCLKHFYGSEMIDISNIRRWLSNVKKVNCELLQIFNLAWFGCSKTVVIDENVQRIDKLICENQKITQHEIACLVGILKERTNHIIKNEVKF